MTRLDLPTFGRPTKAIAAGSSSSAAIAASQRCSGVPELGVDPVLVLLGLFDHERLKLAGSHLLGPRLGFGLSGFPSSFLLALGWQRPDDRVEQVAGPAPHVTPDRVGLLPAEGMELGAFELAFSLSALLTARSPVTIARRRSSDAS